VLIKPSPPTRLASLAIRWLILAAAVWAAAEVVGGFRLEGWESTFHRRRDPRA